MFFTSKVYNDGKSMKERRMKQRNRRGWSIVFWMLAILWIALVFLLSRQTAADSTKLSRPVTEIVLRLFPGLELDTATLEPILRKTAHGVMFAVEGLLLGLACMMNFGRWAGAALSIGISALLAVSSELVQTMAEGRSCELRDMGIDLAGALAGLGLAMLFMLFIDKLSR